MPDAEIIRMSQEISCDQPSERISKGKLERKKNNKKKIEKPRCKEAMLERGREGWSVGLVLHLIGYNPQGLPNLGFLMA